MLIVRVLFNDDGHTVTKGDFPGFDNVESSSYKPVEKRHTDLETFSE